MTLEATKLTHKEFASLLTVGNVPVLGSDAAEWAPSTASFASVWARTDDFRSVPINRHPYHAPACLKRASVGLGAYSGPSPVETIAIAFCSTSTMTAVDHPNISAPFIAAIGPSNCQRSTGRTSP